jgi:hypothetical protein
MGDGMPAIVEFPAIVQRLLKRYSDRNRLITKVKWDAHARNQRLLDPLQQDSATRYTKNGGMAIDDPLIDHDGKLIAAVGRVWDHAIIRPLIVFLTIGLLVTLVMHILGNINGAPNKSETTQNPNSAYNLAATATNVAGQSGAWTAYLPFVNIEAETVNVQTYGAMGNGTTDDTAAIQQAANAASGKTLYFPSGVYPVTGIKILANTKVVGDGPSSSTVKLLPLASGNNTPIFNVLGDNVAFDLLKLDGDRAQQPPDHFSDSYNESGDIGYNQGATGHGRGFRAGIRAESITGLSVTNSEIIGTFGAAIATLHVNAITIMNNFVHDTNFEMAYLYGGGTDVQILNNRMVNLGSGDSSVNADAIVLNHYATVTIAYNSLDTAERCFVKLEAGQNVSIHHNTASISTIGYPGIQLAPSWNQSKPNDTGNVTVDSNTLSNYAIGIQINTSNTQNPSDCCAYAKNVVLSNNTITNNSEYGILMDGDHLDTITIKDNMFDNIGIYAIYVNGSGVNLGISGNTRNAQTIPDAFLGTFTPPHTY